MRRSSDFLAGRTAGLCGGSLRSARGSVNSVTQNGFNFSFIPKHAGTYTVTMTARDDEGTTNVITKQVTVADVPPQDLKISGNGGPEGSTLNFAGSATAGPYDTLRYGWSVAGGPVRSAIRAGSAFSFVPADNGTYTVTMTVTDDEGTTTTTTRQVTVTNVAPVVDAGAGATINEGDTFTGGGSFTDPGADTWTATVDYGDGAGAVPLTLNGHTFSLSHQYADDGVYSVVVTVTDKDGGTGSDAVQVTVNNVAPVVDAGPDQTVRTGSTLTGHGSFVNPGADTWTATVDYGDGGGAAALTLNGKSFSLSHVYAAAGTYTVSVTVTDDDGGVGSDSLTVTVTGSSANVAPTVSAGPAATINEGDTFSSSGSFADPDNDTWTASVDYGDGSGSQSLTLSGKDFSLSHTYADDGQYTVSVTVQDDHEHTGSATTTVTVNNVNPYNVNLTLASATIDEGQSASLSGSFADPGTLDGHTVTINWGDGNSDQPFTLAAGTLSFGGRTHQYVHAAQMGITPSLPRWPTSMAAARAASR